jgi:hypothetical protein
MVLAGRFDSCPVDMTKTKETSGVGVLIAIVVVLGALVVTGAYEMFLPNGTPMHKGDKSLVQIDVWVDAREISSGVVITYSPPMRRDGGTSRMKSPPRWHREAYLPPGTKVTVRTVSEYTIAEKVQATIKVGSRVVCRNQTRDMYGTSCSAVVT